MRRRKPIKKSSKKLVFYSKRRSQKSKLLLLLLSFQIVFSPLLADANIVVDQVRDKQTSVDETRSGVDQVNISSPSAAGVSHNSFDKFNVSQKGVVINNSAEDGVSVIGGAVYKNPNFQKDMREASIILNEVTGTSTSDLQGWTEIFGRSAEYVLANPNGIYVNGAGFINTPKVTLTTGVPAMRGGELLGVGVSQGKITVGSQGVDISGLSYFGILARAAELSGQIADNLGQAQVDVTLGLNDIDYQSKQIKASHQSQEKPEVALDASALGSIFGGSIKIISTEQGVGVNSRGMLWAGVKDVEISSNGKVVCKDVYAKRDVKLEAEASLEQENDGSITAESGDLDFCARGFAEIKSLQAGGDIFVGSEKSLDIAGDVGAKGDISLESAEQVMVARAGDAGVWKVLAGKDLIIKGSDFFNENGKLCSAQDLAVKVLNKIQNDGEVVANGGISLQAKEIENKNLLSAGKSFLSKSNEFVNQDLVVAGESAEFNVVNTLQNKGTIYSLGDLEVTAGLVENLASAELEAGKSLQVQAEDFGQEGLVKSGDDLLLNLGESDFVNKGQISAGSLLLTAGAVENRGFMVSSDSSMAITVLRDFANYDTINSAGCLHISAGQELLNEQGAVLLSDVDMSLSASDGIINRQGKIYADGDLSFLGISTEDLQKFANLDGEIFSQGNLQLQAVEFLNEGGLSVLGDMSLQIEEGDFVNSGDLMAQGSLSIDLKGENFLENSGSIFGTSLAMTAGGLRNQKSIMAGEKGAELTISGDLINSGNLFSQGDLQIQTGGDLQNLAIDGVYAGGDLRMRVEGQLSNEAADFIAAGSIDLRTEQIFSTGNFMAGDSLRMQINSGNFENRGELLGENWLGIEVSGGKIFSNWNLVSGDGMQIKAYKIDNRADILIGGKGGELYADYDVLNYDLISSQGDLLLDVKFDLANYTGSSLLSGGKMKIVTGSDVFNYTNSTIYSGGDLTAEVANLLQNYKGSILSKGDMSLTGLNGEKGSLVKNYGGILHSGGNLLVKSTKLLNQGIKHGSYYITTERIRYLENLEYDNNPYELEKERIVSTMYAEKASILSNGNINFDVDKAINDESQILSRKNIMMVSPSGYDGEFRSYTSSLKTHWGKAYKKKEKYKICGITISWKTKTKKYREDLGWKSDRTGTAQSKTKPLLIAGGSVNISGGVNNGNPSVGEVAKRVLSGSGFLGEKREILTGKLSEGKSNILGLVAVTAAEKQSVSKLAVVKEESFGTKGVSIIADDFQGVFQNPVEAVGIDADFGSKLYRKSKRKSPKYVMESRAEFVSVEGLHGSEYLLDRIDYHPQEEQTFMGDPFYESREISKAIEREYQQRFILEDCQSEQEQYQKLLENGAKAYRDYQLAVGIELSAQQINMLQDPIVWLVETEVDGKTVLMPKLYFPEVLQEKLGVGVDGRIASSQKESENIAGNLDKELVMMRDEIAVAKNGQKDYLDKLKLSADALLEEMQASKEAADDLLAELVDDDLTGSVIKGKSVAISGGTVENSGTILGTQELTMDVESIVNDGGSMEGDAITLKTEGDLVNKSGGKIFAESALSLRVGGDFDNLTDKFTTNYGDEYIHEELGERSMFGSGGTMDMMVGGDFTNRAGDVVVAGDARLIVGGDSKFETISLREKSNFQEGGKSVEIDNKDVASATMDIGGSLVWRSGGDINLRAAKVDVGGYGDIDAKGDINIENDFATTYRKEESSSGGWWSNKKTTEVWQTKKVVGSQVNFGSKMKVSDRSKFADLETYEQTKMITGLESRLLAGENLAEDKSVNTHALEMAKAKVMVTKGEELEKLDNKEDLLAKAKEFYLAAAEEKEFSSSELDELAESDPLMYQVLTSQAKQAIVAENKQKFADLDEDKQVQLESMAGAYLAGEVMDRAAILELTDGDKTLWSTVVSQEKKKYQEESDEKFSSEYENSDLVQGLVSSLADYQKGSLLDEEFAGELFDEEQVAQLEVIKDDNPLLYEKLLSYAGEEAQRELEFDIEYQTRLEAFDEQMSKVANGGGSSLRAGGDITQKGSALSATGDLSKKAGGSIKTYSVEDWEFHDKKVKKGGFFNDVVSSLGIAVVTKKEQTQECVEQVASETKVDGDLDLTASKNIEIVGSDIFVVGDGNIDAGGDLVVSAAAETSYERTMVEKKGFEGGKLEVTSSSASVSATTKKSIDENITTKTTYQKSNLNFGGDLSTNSGGNTNILASDILAGGSIAMVSDADINVLSLQELEDIVEKHEEKSITTSLTVGNRWAETAVNLCNNAKNMVDATQGQGGSGVKAANTASAGVAAYGAAGSAVQTVNDIANSAKTAGTLGFYAGASVTTKTNETKKTTNKSTALGSLIQAGNGISMTAKGKITNQGSDFLAGGDIFLEAEEVEFKAAENSEKEKTESKTTTTTAGGTTDGNLNLGATASVSTSSSSSLTHRNATASAGGTFKVKTKGDATFSGANVVAGDVDLTELGGDLLIESLQDRSKSRAESYSANAGYSGGNVSAGASGSNTKGDKDWVSNQTSILGKNSVKVKAGTLTNRGAKIAQVSNYDELQQEKYEASLEFEGDQEGLAARIAEIDAKQVDGGNLEIAVDELVVENIKDKDKSYTYGVGVSASSSGTNLSFSDGGYDKRQTTYATIGSGSITVGGEEYEGDLNRDINSSQVITKDEKLGGFDVSVNVDHRLFSKEGRQEWKAEKKQEVENFKNVGENVKVASWRVGKSATDLGRAIESGLTNEDVSVLEIGKLYGEAVDRNVNAQKDHKNLVIRDKMNDALGEKGEKSAEDVQTDLRDVANIMREREGAEEGDLYLYEGDELTAENEFDKKGISKKQAKAYHDADNSDIAINVDKTDLTKGAELYGTITEEAVHAGQKARGEVYDSEDGIGGRSEGLAEFANKTASSAWELENKIAGISNESNSLQMDNWRTDNSSSETMLIGLGKVDNAQDVQPEVLDVTRGLNIPVVKKFVNHGFLVVVPDNPEDFTGDKFGALGLENLPAMQDVGNGKKGWVLGAHNKEGSLVVIPNQEQDLEATPQALDYLNGKTKEVTWGNLKTNIPDNGSWNTDIRTVDFGDKTDTEAITDILRNTDNYINNTEINPIDYGPTPVITFTEDYNCNSWKNGNLKEAGATSFDNDFNGIDVGEEILVPGVKFKIAE